TGGAAAVVGTTLLAREVLSERAGWVAAVLALASPFLWLQSEKLTSDAAGLALVTIGLWLCARARRVETEVGDAARRQRTIALLLLGLAMGVRLSYFPIALSCLAGILLAERGRRGIS